jgi:hypothetical protein
LLFNVDAIYTIIKACRRIADDIKTFKAQGWDFSTKSSRTFTPVREKKRKIDDIINELFDQWDGIIEGR